MEFLKYFFLIGFISLGISCTKEDTAPDNQTPKEEEDNLPIAPAFELQNLDGQSVKLSDFKDKVVVLFFFGNNCPSCKNIGPKIESDLNKVHGSNSSFAILGLDQWDGNTASVNSFKSVTGITFPLLQKASATAKAYESTYDRLVVINKKGKIAFRGSRLASSDLADVKALVENLLK